MQYNTGLLIGRAFAIAHGSMLGTAVENTAEGATELCQLADGDRTALLLAQARYREFLVAGPSSSREEEAALALLDAALAKLEREEDRRGCLV